MAVHHFIITADQRDDLMVMNDPNASINPRAIDAANPGVGINLNPRAVGFAVGDDVTLVGKFAAPKRIVAVVPRPSSLSSSIFQPNRSHRRLTMDRPSPLPCGRLGSAR